MNTCIRYATEREWISLQGGTGHTYADCDSLNHRFHPWSSLTLTGGTTSLRDEEFSAKNRHGSKTMTSR